MQPTTTECQSTAAKAIYDQLPGLWCRVDNNSRFTYLNTEYAKLVGIKDELKSIYLGKTVADLPCKASECADLFWQEDAIVKKYAADVQIINVIQLANDEWKIIELLKRPIFDACNQLDSIIFKIVDHTNKNMAQLGKKLSMPLTMKTNNKQSSFLISNKNEQVKLSPKEAECLFFLLRGHTFKQIAAIQNVSCRTIIDHAERLKFKFHSQSKPELISNAIELGYFNKIPDSLFNQQLSIIL